MPSTSTTYCFKCKHTVCNDSNHSYYKISSKKIRYPKKNSNKSKMKKFFKWIWWPEMILTKYKFSDWPIEEIKINLKQFL